LGKLLKFRSEKFTFTFAHLDPVKIRSCVLQRRNITML